MTQKVYTMGYGGQKLPLVQKAVAELGAVIFDIRYSPRSRNPTWNGANLRRVLGARYRHVKAFGNRNYKGGPVEIVDYEAGKKAVEQCGRPVILMCVCRDYQRCHRRNIAEQLRADGFEVEELDPSAPAITQQRLF